MTDVRYNDEAHAYMHAQSQASDGDNLLNAAAKQVDFVNGRIQDGASDVLSGNQKGAEEKLGEALHAEQTGKHDFIQFSLHTGNPLNDCQTQQGCQQLLTDVFPTGNQLRTGAQVTAQTLQRFQDKVWELGKQQGLSDKEIRKRLNHFPCKVPILFNRGFTPGSLPSDIRNQTWKAMGQG